MLHNVDYQLLLADFMRRKNIASNVNQLAQAPDRGSGVCKIQQTNMHKMKIKEVCQTPVHTSRQRIERPLSHAAVNPHGQQFQLVWLLQLVEVGASIQK